jgi:hypothetical protein
MAPAASRRSANVLWSGDRNAATEALIGVAPGDCDILVNLLCRDIIETANCFGEECYALTRRAIRHILGPLQIQVLILPGFSLGFVVHLTG